MIEIITNALIWIVLIGISSCLFILANLSDP